MDRFTRVLAGLLGRSARLLPASRRGWAAALLAEAGEVPAGAARAAWLAHPPDPADRNRARRGHRRCVVRARTLRRIHRPERPVTDLVGGGRTGAAPGHRVHSGATGRPGYAAAAPGHGAAGRPGCELRRRDGRPAARRAHLGHDRAVPAPRARPAPSAALAAARTPRHRRSRPSPPTRRPRRHGPPRRSPGHGSSWSRWSTSWPGWPPAHRCSAPGISSAPPSQRRGAYGQTFRHMLTKTLPVSRVSTPSSRVASQSSHVASQPRCQPGGRQPPWANGSPRPAARHPAEHRAGGRPAPPITVNHGKLPTSTGASTASPASAVMKSIESDLSLYTSADSSFSRHRCSATCHALLRRTTTSMSSK
jgi:hypothetical protein